MILSIIIPSRNRPNHLDNCLTSIHKTLIDIDNYHTSQIDIHVVLDGCAYPYICRKWKCDPQIHFWQMLHSGAAAARNYGAARATGKYLAFIDDDCVVAIKWLSTVIRDLHQLSSEIVALGGSVIALEGRPTVTGNYLRAIDHLNGPICENEQIVNMATANLIVRHDAFRSIKGFDERLSVGAEDENLCVRLREIGELDFDGNIIVYHHHDISIRSFWRKFIRYGYGVAQHIDLTPTDMRDNSSPYYPLWITPVKILSTLPTLLRRLRKASSSRKDDQLASPLFTCFATLQEIAFQLGVLIYHQSK